MKMKIVVSVFLFAGFYSAVLFADSPLTSTDFSNAYMDEPIVQNAAMKNGILTEDLMSFLSDQSKPVAVKMAVINKLGWNIDGKNNRVLFINYLKSKKKYNTGADILSKASGDELLCLAYIGAMDNYFKVDDAILYAESALKKNPKSFTYNIISALIKSQKYMMDNSWCEVFAVCDSVRKNKDLNKDFRESAIKIIFDYIGDYKGYCK